ncbi:hypothetical protein GJT83_02455 (plasmid) [Enterobacteriaceae endosymbiont of Plateumaris pusilla]|uniref:prephenate dehydratase domain-containing protein n=1 Tax=Enterobacteriaceae endosymbiont of Plateumaris pusilla TaxID=2675795 RepID=UPI001449AB49|nr:prephenate dehydratase domain-containing protein [Enterobacteriaceae endosymbiont of Plateumaris pusilla]QJC29765.1 hypothetical protein GJT83_02455 [Enterobacteriaceae endosymbiont of Plateumaris pusilla]
MINNIRTKFSFYFAKNKIKINNLKYFIKHVYSSNLQKNNSIISIAFLGPQGTYSYLATLAYIENFFSRKKIFNVSCNNFSELFFSMERNIINFAIVPIENSCSGIIKEVNKLLKHSSLKIFYQFKIPIKHRLISYNKFTNINDIDNIFSHSEPFKQCSIFINKHPFWKKNICNSTADAIKKLFIFKLNNFAAIGNKETAKLFNLNIIKTPSLSNKIDNTTKFLVLTKN